MATAANRPGVFERYIPHEATALETVTLGYKQWQMIRLMMEFHDGDEDVLEHMGCTQQEWSDLLDKFDLKSCEG